MIKIKKNSRKIIAPIIISVFSILYCMFFGFVILIEDIHIVTRLLFLIIPIIIIGIILYVLKERINEIRSGEEDDLSKY